MKVYSCVLLLFILPFAFSKECPNKRINSKLICYYSKLSDIDPCYCTHVILPANAELKGIESAKKSTGAKILLTVTEFNQGLIETVKKNNIDGLEIKLKKLDSKNDITEFISTVRSRLGNDLFLALSVPPKTELLAKYYDLKALSKSADLFILQTAFLGASKNVTFHPSRLSGLWDMQNTDSVVDLVTGLGTPLSKLAITAPVQAFQFKLQDKRLTTPGSPAIELKSITRDELCSKMNSGDDWMLERDQDQAGPYIFRKNQWISFEDHTSMDIKAKYARVRGLAGLALKDVSMDGGSKCGTSLLEAAHAGLTKQNRATRGAVLRSLEREILETPARPLDTVHVSPFRISRVIDVEGHVHTIRKDTRTEFTCSRQGYFVHPHSCGRFYRCVKFDQQTEEYSVFEFDCPAGLAFDSRWEVCVWPGSLPHGTPCAGSSEIAPVPRERFTCPSTPGYYADPENCRWFFACLDHGKSGLTAYEFRCPFGLVYDEKRLLCEWPWLVPTCANGQGLGLELDSLEFFGGIAGTTIGATKTTGTVVQAQDNLGYVLNSYDGLGSLGTVQLGGYSGDLNSLVNTHGSSGEILGSGNLFANGHFGEQNTFGALQSSSSLLDNSGYLAEGSQGNLHLHVADSSGKLTGSENIGLFLNQGAVSSSNIQQGYLQGDSLKLDTGLNGKTGVLSGGFAYQNSGKSVLNTGYNSGSFGAAANNAEVEYHGNFGLKTSGADFSSKNTGQAIEGIHLATNGEENIGLVNSGATSFSNVAFDDIAHYNLNNNAGKVSLVNTASLDTGAKAILVNNQGIESKYNGHVGAIQYADLGEKVTLLDSNVKTNLGSNQNLNGDYLINKYKNSGATSSSSFVQHHQNEGVISDENLKLANNYGQYGAIFNGYGKQNVNAYNKFYQDQYKLQAQFPAHTIGYLDNTNIDNIYKNQAQSSQYITQTHNAVSQSLYNKFNSANVNLPATYYTGNGYYGDNQYGNLTYATQYLSPVNFGTTLNTGKSNTYFYGKQGQSTVPVEHISALPKYQSIYSGKQGKSFQSVTLEHKVPLREQVFVAPEIHAVSVTPTYDTQYQGQNYQNIEFGLKTGQKQIVAPQVKTVPITTKTESVIVQQPQVYVAPKIETVSVAPKVQSNYGSLGTSYQSISYKTQPELIAQQFYVAPKVETVSVAPKIETKYGNLGTSYQSVSYKAQPQLVESQVYVAPKVETVSVAPKFETNYGSLGTSYQSVSYKAQPEIVEQQVYVAPKVETVSIAPKIETNYGSLGTSYQSVSYKAQPQIVEQQVYVAPKVETVSVAPKIETNYGSLGTSYQSVSYKAQPQIVEQQVYVAPKVETVSVAPKIETNHGSLGTSYHSVSYKAQPQIVEQQVYVAPKVETVSVAPKIETNYGNLGTSYQSVSYKAQPQIVEQQVYVAPKVETISVAQKPGPNFGSLGTSYQSLSYKTQPQIIEQQVYVAPKVETVSVAPSIETNYGSLGTSYQSLTYKAQPQIVEQQQVYIAPKLETVSVAPKVQTNYGSVGSSFQSISYKAQPQIVEQQQVYVAPKLETVSVAPKVQTNYGSVGSSFQSISYKAQPQIVEQQQVYVAPKLETVSVTPKIQTNYGSVGSSFRSISYKAQPQIVEQQQVYVAPKVETISYKPKGHTNYGSLGSSFQSISYKSQPQFVEQQQVYVAPKLETVSVAPQVETNYGTLDTSYQSVSYKAQPQIVEQQKVYVPPKVETVSFAPKVETNYGTLGTSYQSVSYKTKPQIVQQQQVYVAPKVQTQYYKKQETVQPLVQKVPVLTVTPQYETYTATPKTTFYQKQETIPVNFEQQQYVPQKTVLNIKQQSREYLPSQVPETVFVSSTPSYSAANIHTETKFQPKQIQTVTAAPIIYETYSFQPSQQPSITNINIKSAPAPETLYIPTTQRPYFKQKSYVPSTEKYDIYNQFSNIKLDTAFVSQSYKPQNSQVFVPSTPKYNVLQEYIQPQVTPIVSNPKPYVVKSQIYTSSTPKYVEFEEYAQSTPKPYIYTSTPKYIQQESIVISTPKPFVAKAQQVYVTSTPKYNVFQEYIQPKQTIVNTAPQIVLPEFKYENKVNTNQNYKYEGQNTYVSKEYDNFDAFDYFQDYKEVNFELPRVQQKTIYYNTPKPTPITQEYIALKNYQTDYVVSTPKPTIVSTIAPIIKQTARLPTKVVAINKYIVTTPTPVYIARTTPIVKSVKPTQTSTLTYYDSRFDATPEYNDYETSYTIATSPPKIVSTIKPVVARKKIVATSTVSPLGEFYDSRFVSTAPQQYLKETTFEKNNDYNTEFVVTTVRPKPTIRPVVIKKKLLTTTAVPLDEYDSVYVTSEKFAPSTEQYLKEVSDIQNNRDFDSTYLVSTLKPKITVRPVIRKKIVATTTAFPIIEDYTIGIQKSKQVEITPKPKGKTIVRVNDFHPFLTTKLGAQCTCTSNTLQLRKKSKQISQPVFDYENLPVTKLTSDGPANYDNNDGVDDEPGVYVVGNSDSTYEDYDYESKKISVTPIPEEFVSTTNAVQPAPTPVYTFRKKVTTVTPLEVSSVTIEPDIYYSTPKSREELFLRKSSAKNGKSKEEKIAETVKEGLSLVKSAIKGYIKEAISESVSALDRSGGWGSRDGTQDCQREGLFRHPTQCNKFYACHWDCKKQKYTLHEFNCPVHLTFDSTMGACNWPTKGPACSGNTLLPAV